MDEKHGVACLKCVVENERKHVFKVDDMPGCIFPPPGY